MTDAELVLKAARLLAAGHTKKHVRAVLCVGKDRLAKLRERIERAQADASSETAPNAVAWRTETGAIVSLPRAGILEGRAWAQGISS